MLPFRALDADLAQREVRVLHVEAGGGLPAGAYLFEEAYCTEPGCDCRRVLLQVLHAETRTHVATINYAFEPPKPPHDVEGQVFLDRLNPQSDVSAFLLEFFVKSMLSDKDYVARLHRHYDLWKRAVDDPSHPAHPRLCPPGTGSTRPAFPRQVPARRSSARIGPNAPCPCGSGKKFKRCCGN